MGWKDTIKKPGWRDTITSSTKEAPTETKPSGVDPEALARGAMQGVTLGFGDEIGGAIDVLLSKTGTLLTPEASPNPYEGQSVKDVYKSGREEEREANVAAKERSPIQYGAGQLGGAVVGGIPLGGGIASLAGQGAAAGLGGSESEDTGQQAKDTLFGLGLGALGGAAAKTAGYVGGKALDALSTGTPVATTATKAVQFATRLPDEAVPSSVTLPSKPADWFFKTRGGPEKVYASATLPEIAKKAGSGVEDSLDLAVASFSNLQTLPAQIARRIMQSETGQKLAQKGLHMAGPSLQKADVAVNAGATLFKDTVSKLSPKFQQALSKGGKQAAISHFLLSTQNKEYQNELKRIEEEDKKK